MNCVVCIQEIGERCVRCPTCRKSVFCDKECYKIGKHMHRPICQLLMSPQARYDQDQTLSKLIKQLIKNEPLRYVANIIQANTMLSATCILFRFNRPVSKLKQLKYAEISGLSLIESRDFALELQHAGLATELERLNYAKEMIFLMVQEDRMAFHSVVCRNINTQTPIGKGESSVHIYDIQPRGVRYERSVQGFVERVLCIAETSVIFNVKDPLWHYAKAAAIITIDLEMSDKSDESILSAIDNCFTQYLNNSVNGRIVYFMCNKGVDSYPLVSVEFISAISFAVEHSIESCSNGLLVQSPFYVIGDDENKRMVHSLTYSTYTMPK